RSYGDWSSDVCSSDLFIATWRSAKATKNARRFSFAWRKRKSVMPIAGSKNYVIWVSRSQHWPTLSGHGSSEDSPVHSEPISLFEIGRASCRERGYMKV